ncbi:uncharacterized protein LOC111104144 isoform X2 [Crassostrea virginica]
MDQKTQPQISPVPVDEVTVERRTHALSHLFKLSLVSVGVATGSIVVGILVLVYSSGASFPIITGAPVWSGTVVLVAGLVGVQASKSDVRYGTVPAPRDRCLLMTHYVLSISCLSVTGICFGYSLTGFVTCQTECGNNSYQELILNGIAFCLALLMLLTAVAGSVFFCVYKRLFGLYSPREMLFNTRIAELENRIRYLESPPNQQQGFSQYGGQYGYNSFSTPSTQPPAYSK